MRALLHYFRRGTGWCGACEQALELHRGRLDQVPRQCSQHQRRDEADQGQPEDADLVAQQVDRQLLEREGVDVHAVREVTVFAEPGEPGQRRIGQVDDQVGQRYGVDDWSDRLVEGQHQCEHQHAGDPAAPRNAVAVQVDRRPGVVEQAQLEDVLHQERGDPEPADEPEMTHREKRDRQRYQAPVENAGQPHGQHAQVHHDFQWQGPQRAVHHVGVDVLVEDTRQLVMCGQEDVQQIRPGGRRGEIVTRTFGRHQRTDDEDRQQHRQGQRRQDA